MATTVTSAHQVSNENQPRRSRANVALWILQVVLAALFLFAGGMKFALPVESMTKGSALPGWFFRFIGVAEVLGALGLVLPWALDIRRELTPIAAGGLVAIMIGATTLMLRLGGFGSAAMPFTVGCLLIVVAYGRW